MQLLLDAVTLGAIYSLFAIGMSLTWGNLGVLNFAHGAFMMFSSFTVFMLLRAVGLPLVPVLIIAAGVGALLSVVVQLVAFGPILRRTRDHRAAELQILIAGIGAAVIPHTLAQNGTGSTPFGFQNSSFEVETVIIGGLRTSNISILILVLSVAACVALYVWLRRSKSGLALRSLGVDSEIAGLMGVNQRRLSILAFALSGALAGLAGALITFKLGAITAETGDYLLIKAFAVIVLGGVGSIPGAILGAYLLALAESLILTQTSGSWVDAIAFGLIFLVLLVRPNGIFGRAAVRRV